MRFILFIFTVLIIGCGSDIGRDYHLDEHSFDANSLKIIEERTNITFPQGARGLNMFYQGTSIDPSILAKIQIPTSEYQMFKKQLEKIPNSRGGINASSLTGKVTWWNPSESTLIMERLFNQEMNGVHVMFCKEHDRFILYVIWIKV
ncbi:MAG: hypothetical protein ABIK15_15220 [Pseudomonadota bacterium]